MRPRKPQWIKPPRRFRENWLGNLDSNQDYLSQSQAGYRYPIPQSSGDPMGIRTPVCAVRGRRPRPLDDGASKVVDRVGLEPTTCRLRVGCSTIELAVRLDHLRGGQWRSERDLNPRGTYAPYSFSKAAPSATWVSLHVTELKYITVIASCKERSLPRVRR
jgi:hypothetical protein